ncbi:MAG TPA: MFS transporter [Steroidobacteraceae bacterium]|nr:MFS transporter [Steroidobacteraceae bacterium]
MTAAPDAPPPGVLRRVLAERLFLRYLTTRFAVSLAVQIQTVAVGIQVYDLTHDPLDLGLIGLSQFLPFIVLILPAGHLADTRDRRRILTLCFVTMAICAALLLAAATHGLGSARPVFAVMVLFGVARAFAMPTGQALLPNLVEREHFGVAVALNSSLWQVSTIAGPALGGLLYLAGATTVYATVLVLLCASVLLLLTVRRGGASGSATQAFDREAVLSGLRFVWRRRPVLGAISLDLFAVLFGGATALLPVFAADVLHIGPSGLGWLRAGPGIGAAICGVVLSASPPTRRVGLWMFGGVAVYGAATLVFGASREFWLSLAALILMGAGDMVSVYIRHLLVQLETPDEIRGRVSAVNAVFIGASNELGEFESGLTAAWFGTVPAVLLGAGLTLGVAAGWARLFPELRRMDRFPSQ